MDPAAHYIYGDIPVQATAAVSTSLRATPEEIVAMAVKIWGEVRASGVAAGDDEGNDSLLAQLQEKHKDFGLSFPLVLRWMVQMRAFSPAALKKYLLKHAAARLDTSEAFLRLQAEYLVLISKEANPHQSEGATRQYREGVIQALLREDEAFKAITRQVEADIAQQDAALNAERRQRLYETLLAQKVRREVSARALP